VATPITFELISLPVQPDHKVTHFDATIRLGDRAWFFSFYTNSEGGWFMNIGTDPSTPVIAGIGIATGLDLLFPFRHLDVPPGPLWVLDRNNSDADPDDTGFADGRYSLVYVDLAASTLEA
jgi:hypothetical protein